MTGQPYSSAESMARVDQRGLAGAAANTEAEQAQTAPSAPFNGVQSCSDHALRAVQPDQAAH